jgi:hypothetical protein
MYQRALMLCAVALLVAGVALYRNVPHETTYVFSTADPYLPPGFYWLPKSRLVGIAVAALGILLLAATTAYAAGVRKGRSTTSYDVRVRRSKWEAPRARWRGAPMDSREPLPAVAHAVSFGVLFVRVQGGPVRAVAVPFGVLVGLNGQLQLGTLGALVLVRLELTVHGASSFSGPLVRYLQSGTGADRVLSPC